MRVVSRLLIFCLLFVAASGWAKDKKNRLVFPFEGHQRTVYFYMPPDPGEKPIVVLLHGSGRDGTEMLNPWLPLATSEHFILAAPDALHPEAWDSEYDSVAFLHAVVDQVRALHPVDARRIYLFGHSAGAVYALAMALLDDRFYAAVAVHAGALPEHSEHLFTYPDRHMPVAIWVGDQDPSFPITRVQATRKAFEAHGFTVQLSILKNHTHDYSEVADKVDRLAWQFFQAAQLPPPQPAQ